MRWKLAIAGWLLLSVMTGCRNRAAQELLERELRMQEDRIYQLEDELAMLASENDALKHFPSHGVVVKPSTSGSSSTNDRSPDRSTRPMSREPNGPPVEIPMLPTVELPKTSKVTPFRGPPAIAPPGEGFPEADSPAPLATTKPIVTPAQRASSSQLPASPVEPVAEDIGPAMAPAGLANARSEDVSKITLHETSTAGYDDDGRAGDDGIRVVIEPRSAGGQILAAAGRISFVLMDPLVTGPSSRVARWDFTVEQAAHAYDKTAESEGLHFELPWIDMVPTHRTMHLFVRYHTADGRKLDVDKELDLALRPIEDRRSVQPLPPPVARGGIPSSNRAPVRNVPPVARLLTPDFNTPPSDSIGPQLGEPTLAPPRGTRSAEAPRDELPIDRNRTGAKWSPYR